MPSMKSQGTCLDLMTFVFSVTQSMTTHHPVHSPGSYCLPVEILDLPMNVTAVRGTMAIQLTRSENCYGSLRGPSAWMAPKLSGSAPCASRHWAPVALERRDWATRLCGSVPGNIRGK